MWRCTRPRSVRIVRILFLDEQVSEAFLSRVGSICLGGGLPGWITPEHIMGFPASFWIDSMIPLLLR
jgi:hypothetical protein